MKNTSRIHNWYKCLANTKESVPCAWDENGKATMFEYVKGPNDTSYFDIEGYQKHHNRINNGTRLFGKYYRNLWD
jgi:hypothetical protein